MKRTVKILALALVFIMAATVLVGCGTRLSGTYEYVNGNSVEILSFDGKDFVYKVDGVELRGTYEIEKKGEDYTITMIEEEYVVDGKVGAPETPEPIYEKAMIRIGEDYITIGSGTDAVRYSKK